MEDATLQGGEPTPAPKQEAPAQTMARMLSAGVPKDKVAAWYTKHYGTGGGAAAPAPAAVAPKEVTPHGSSGTWGDEPEPPSELKVAAGHGLNTLQGVPGAKAAEAWAGVGGSHLASLLTKEKPLTYQESLKKVEDLTGLVPEGYRQAEQFMGGMFLTPEIKLFKGAKTGVELAKQALKNAAVTGGTMGAADAALSADPNQTVGERAKNTAIGGAFGTALGAATSKAGQIIKPRAAALADTWRGLRAGSSDALANATEQEGKAIVSDAYTRALESARGKKITPPVQDMLSTSIGRQAIRDVRLQGIQPGSPEFLDEVFKSVSTRVADQGGDAPGLKGWQRDFISALGQQTEQAPTVIPGRETIQGPLRGGQRGQTLPGHETIQGPLTGGQRGQVLPGRDETITGPILEGPAGRARGDVAQVSVDKSGRAIPVSPRDVQGPAGPNFMLRARPPEVVTPEIPAKPAFVLRGQGPQVVTPEIPPTPGFVLRGTGAEVRPNKPIPALMPQYGNAVDAAIAKGSQQRAQAEAIKAGASEGNLLSTLKTMLSSKSPSGFERWAENASWAEKQQALEMLQRVKAERAVESAKLFKNPLQKGVLPLIAGHLGGPGSFGAAAILPALERASNPKLYEALRQTSPVQEETLLRILRGMNATEQTAQNNDRLTPP